MNHIEKKIGISLISVCMVYSILSCSPANEYVTTLESISDTVSDDNAITMIETGDHGLSVSTETSSVINNAQTEIPASSIIEAGKEILAEEHSCIGNFSDFAYFGAKDRQTQIEQPGFPLPPWEEVIDFGITERNYLALVRQYQGDIEIWIRNIVTDEIIVYNPETHEQHISFAKSKDYPDMMVNPVFVLSDETVWGRNLVYGEINKLSYNSFPPLSRYNEESRQFEIPEGMFTISLDGVRWDISSQPQIILDKDDVFWIFIQYDGLYQYDTHTGRTKKVLQTPDMAIRNAVMDRYGGIYFNNPTLGWKIAGLKSGEILYFNPELNKLELVPTPDQDWPVVLNLYVDTEGRLWTDISGYRDTDGKWTLLHENIDDYFNYFTLYTSWDVPSIKTQTSDGRFWVQRQDSSYNNGTAWFDPETGEGCWFTSYTSRIVEDANHRLWFEADGKLFKNELLP